MNLCLDPFLTGFPISYFAGAEPFRSWLSSKAAAASHTEGPLWPHTVAWPDRPNRIAFPSLVNQFGESAAQDWTNHVVLERFSATSAVTDPSRSWYEYTMEFSAHEEIGFGIPSPKGTIVLFGGKKKEDSCPDRCCISFMLHSKLGEWMRTEISGDLRFRLPQSLVTPVHEIDGQWKDRPDRAVIAPLGNSTLILTRGEIPLLTSPLSIPEIDVRIGQTEIIVRLSELDLSGNFPQPVLRFSKIKTLYQPK